MKTASLRVDKIIKVEVVERNSDITKCNQCSLSGLCVWLFVVVVLMLTIIKPVVFLVTYTWDTLRAIGHAVYTLFTTTVSLRHARMYAHVQASS